MVELLRLHTQQAHPVVSLPRGGGVAGSYQGGAGWGWTTTQAGGEGATQEVVESGCKPTQGRLKSGI